MHDEALPPRCRRSRWGGCEGLFSLPGSVQAITPLVWEILMQSEQPPGAAHVATLYLCYNEPIARTIFAAESGASGRVPPAS